MLQRIPKTWVLFLALCCGGCAVATIDVDVYKGPLTNERGVQTEQIGAMAIGAKPLLVQLRDLLEWNGNTSGVKEYDDDYMPTYQFQNKQAIQVNAILSLYGNLGSKQIAGLIDQAKSALLKYKTAYALVREATAQDKPFADLLSRLDKLGPPVGFDEMHKRGYTDLLTGYRKLFARTGAFSHEGFVQYEQLIVAGHILLGQSGCGKSVDFEKHDLLPECYIDVGLPQVIIYGLYNSAVPSPKAPTTTQPDLISANGAFKALTEAHVVEAHAELFIPGPTNADKTQRENFVQRVHQVAQGFLDARKAICQLYDISLRLVESADPNNPESGQTVADYFMKLYQPDAVLSALNATNTDANRPASIAVLAARLGMQRSNPNLKGKYDEKFSADKAILDQRDKVIETVSPGDIVNHQKALAAKLSAIAELKATETDKTKLENQLKILTGELKTCVDHVNTDVNMIVIAEEQNQQSTALLAKIQKSKNADLDLWDAFKPFFRKELVERPKTTARALEEGSMWFTKIPGGQPDREPDDAIQAEMLRNFQPGASRIFGFARGPTLSATNTEIDPAKLRDALEVVDSSFGPLGNGRLPNGINSLIDAYLLANYKQIDITKPGKEPGNVVQARERMLAALTEFAVKILFITNNNVLLPNNGDNSGTGESDNTNSSKLLLQSIGNSILVQINELRQAADYDSQLHEDHDGELQALVSAFDDDGATALDRLQTDLTSQRDRLGKQSKDWLPIANAVYAICLYRQSKSTDKSTATVDLHGWQVRDRLLTWIKEHGPSPRGMPCTAPSTQQATVVVAAISPPAAGTTKPPATVAKTTPATVTKTTTTTVAKKSSAAGAKKHPAAATQPSFTADQTRDAIAVIKDYNSTADMPPISPPTKDRATSKDVIDQLIRTLSLQKVRAIEESGPNSARVQRLAAAIKESLDIRSGMIYLRPASSFLKSSYPATSLQTNAKLAWQNTLEQHLLRTGVPVIPSVMAKSEAQVLSEIDKQFWQNINTVRVAGAGDTNYVIAKDDIGNWYIKTYSNNVNDIVQAAGGLVQYAMGPAGGAGALGKALANSASNTSTSTGNNSSSTQASTADVAFNNTLSNYQTTYATDSATDYKAITDFALPTTQPTTQPSDGTTPSSSSATNAVPQVEALIQSAWTDAQIQGSDTPTTKGTDFFTLSTLLDSVYKSTVVSSSVPTTLPSTTSNGKPAYGPTFIKALQALRDFHFIMKLRIAQLSGLKDPKSAEAASRALTEVMETQLGTLLQQRKGTADRYATQLQVLNDLVTANSGTSPASNPPASSTTKPAATPTKPTTSPTKSTATPTKSAAK